jgi:hypothetical protein
MTTSQTSFLSKPIAGEKIPPATLSYMRARAKRRAFDLVLREFKRSGLTRAEVARRLGKGAPEISRMLGGPSNWTIQTVSDLLFAISAAEPQWELSYPLDAARRNYIRPDWLDDQSPLLREAFPPAANSLPTFSGVLLSPSRQDHATKVGPSPVGNELFRTGFGRPSTQPLSPRCY